MTMPTTPTATATPNKPSGSGSIAAVLSRHLTVDELAGPLPVSVWECATQRISGRTFSEAASIPGTMLPELARHVIEAYTRPGEIVLDPLCGNGTVVIEAARAARTGVGIEQSPRRAQIAMRNLERAALDHGVPGRGYIWHQPHLGELPAALYEHYQGRVALALTALPAPSAQRPRRHHYSDDAPAYVTTPAARMSDPKSLMLSFTEILRTTREVMKPGGVIAVAARTQRHRGQLIDYPSAVISAGRIAGLTPIDRIAILTHRIEQNAESDDRRAAPPRSAARRRLLGHRPAIVVHQDLLLFATA